MPHNRHMCRFLVLWISSLLLVNVSYATEHRYRVALIDSGIDLKDHRFKSVLCEDGHIDFTGEGMFDMLGHGTGMASIIMNTAKDYEGKYCLVIYKVFGNRNFQKSDVFGKAFNTAVMNGIKLVNFSGGGQDNTHEEYIAIRKGMFKGTTFVVAAMNEGLNMDDPDNKFYPACYRLSNVITVGSIDKDGNRSKFSNYGKDVKVWEVGEGVLVYLPLKDCSALYTDCVGYSQGTSDSTAIHTGKQIIKRLSK